jgi:Rod binding protein.
MYNQELAKKMTAAGGIGLADMMYAQLSRSLVSASRSTATDAAGTSAPAFTPAAAPMLAPAPAAPSASEGAEAAAKPASNSAAASIYGGVAPMQDAGHVENGSARANTVTGAQPAAAGANPEEAARLEQQALQASAQPERHKVVRTTNIPGNMNSGINLARMAQFEAGSKLGANTVRPSMQQVMGLSQAQRQQNWGQAAGQNSPAMDIPPLTGESAGGQVFGSPMAAEAAARLPGQPTSAAGQTTPMPGQTMGMNQTPQQPQRIHYTTNIPPKGRNNRQGLIRTLNVDSAGPNSKAGAGIAAYHAQQAQGGGMQAFPAPGAAQRAAQPGAQVAQLPMNPAPHPSALVAPQGASPAASQPDGHVPTLATQAAGQVAPAGSPGVTSPVPLTGGQITVRPGGQNARAAEASGIPPLTATDVYGRQ